ncbi:MAG: hypothetical protein M1823_002573 [Watsoniomyces obsoletus]|nr:MAG: hypothetical protein M1823_002573 [Watsoniomyces obsoletus]
MTVVPDNHFRPLSANPGGAHTVKPKRSRVHMTEADNVALVQLCVAQCALYQPRKLSKFWQLISVLLAGKTSKQLKDPRRTMEELSAQRIITIKRQESESGRLQEAMELSAALDCWLEVIKAHDDQLEERRLNQLEAEAQTKASQEQTEELLLTIGRRRRRFEDNGSDDDLTVNSEQGSHLLVPPNPGKQRKKSRSRGREAELAAAAGITSGLNNIAQAIDHMAGSVQPVEERVNTLEKKMDDQEEAQIQRHQELLDAIERLR